MTYLVALDMLDIDGKPVGEQQEFEVSVDPQSVRPGAPEPGEDEAGAVAASFSFAEGLGSGALVTDGAGGFTVVVGLTDAGDVLARDVQSVNLSFLEPFEGPAPLQPQLEIPLSGEVQKWVLKAPAGLTAGGSAAVEVALVDEDGAVIDQVSASGTPTTGRVYRSANNGGGADDTGTFVDIDFDLKTSTIIQF